MQDNNSILFGPNDMVLYEDNMYYLSYPDEGTLINYLINEGIYRNNHFESSFAWGTPRSWFIGDYSTMSYLYQTIGDKDGYNKTGTFRFSNHVRPDSLIEEVNEHLRLFSPPLIVISGINQISFKLNEVSKELEYFLYDLHDLQNRFKTTILLSGTTRDKNADFDKCVPNLKYQKDEIEIITEICADIQMPVGSMKLFHIPKGNHIPVKILSDDRWSNE